MPSGGRTCCVFPRLYLMLWFLVTMISSSPAWSQHDVEANSFFYKTFGKERTPCSAFLNSNDFEARISCLRDNGYPYANICGYTPSAAEMEVCKGPLITIEDFAFSKEIPLRDQLIEQLGSFRAGQFYNQSQVVAFLDKFEKQFDISDARANFEKIGLRSVRMVVGGTMQRSSVSGGLFYTESGNFQISVFGRHYQSAFAPGFVNYSLYHEPTTNARGGAVSFPIGVTDQGFSTLLFQSDKLQRFRYDNDVRKLGIRYELKPYSDRFQLSQVQLDLVTSEIKAKSGSLHEFDYGVFSAQWRTPILEKRFVVGIDAYLQDGSDLVSQVSASNFYENVGVPGPFSHLFIKTSGRMVLGEVEDMPLTERIYAGGSSLRGYRVDEVGTQGLDVSNWGGSSLLTLQIDTLAPIEAISDKFLAGLHFDAGYFEGVTEGSNLYASYGVAARYQFDKKNIASANFSTNKSGRKIFSISIDLLSD